MAHEMPLHAAAVRRRRGILVAGDCGRSLVADAENVVASQGIRDPASWSRMLAPQ